MFPIFLVAIGGALAAGARWATSVFVMQANWPAWIATFGVNALGGLAIGILAGLVHDPTNPWRAFLGVGVLGGFTTFSTFSLEIVGMVERHHYGLALAYAGGSLLAAIAFCALGLIAARSFS